MSAPSDVQAWLEAFVREHGGVAGTVHTRASQDLLALAAALNIPPAVVDIIQRIPKGKGMAGLAFEGDRVVSTCNIKDDKTGAVRPRAKAVQAEAAIALPVHAASGDIRAVVGIAYPHQRDFTEPEIAALAAAAATLPAQ